jgi:hypothetical protein
VKVSLEGTTDEVFGMMLALVGGTTDSVTVASTPEPAGAPMECPQMFEDLVRMWAQDFDSSGTAHWNDNAPIKADKGEKLREIAVHRKNGKVLKWIGEQGGLTYAVYVILGDKKLARLVAVNMSQVGSVLFNDITLLLEHYDPFEDE